MSGSHDVSPTTARSRILFGVAYALAVASVIVGAALVSSMGGELPVDDPTVAERSRWAWGNTLTATGAALTVGCAALLVVGRRRLGLTLGAAAGAALVATFLIGLLYLLAWGASMA